MRRRVSKAATAAFTAIVSLCAGTAAQSDKTTAGTSKGKTASSSLQNNQPVLSGTVIDVNGAALAGVKVTVINETTKQRETAISDEKGGFQFPSLAAGSYTLQVKVKSFETFKRLHITVSAVAPSRVDVNLLPKGTEVFVGIVLDSRSEFSTSMGTTTIRLPD